ncbi:MAG: cation:proton antiporter [Sulfurospirillum sp.]|nr:MAG: cation:proton antiporter [Sulfurospirillum sp.]
MDNAVSIIVTLSIIIFISPYISRFLKIPTTPVEIILGTVMGYFHFLGENHLFELIAEVGFYYLMFLAGMEVNIRDLMKMDREIKTRGLIYISLLYIFSYISVKSVGFDTIFTLFLPLISVGLIVTLYKEYGKETKWLNLSMQIGVLGELVSIIALTVTGAMLKHGYGIELYETLGFLALFLLALVVVFKLFRLLFWWYPEIKTYLIPLDWDKDEKDIRLSMALFFLMIAVMLMLDLEIAFGAFIAGIFIATFFEHQRELPHKLSTFGFGFLVPIFFVYTGSTFKLEALQEEGLVIFALMITASMIGIRMLSAIAFFKIFNFKEMLLFSLSHSMPLTLLVAIAALGYHNNRMIQFEYYAFILASLFEVIIVMVSIKTISVYSEKQRRKRTSVKK